MYDSIWWEASPAQHATHYTKYSPYLVIAARAQSINQSRMFERSLQIIQKASSLVLRCSLSWSIWDFKSLIQKIIQNQNRTSEQTFPGMKYLCYLVTSVLPQPTVWPDRHHRTYNTTRYQTSSSHITGYLVDPDAETLAQWLVSLPPISSTFQSNKSKLDTSPSNQKWMQDIVCQTTSRNRQSEKNDQQLYCC